MNVTSKINDVKSYALTTSKKIGSILIIIISLGCGFTIGYYYNLLSGRLADTNQFKHINTITETSVAINEKNQILIMDRNNGTFKIYDESVGDAIALKMLNKAYMSTVNPIKTDKVNIK